MGSSSDMIHWRANNYWLNTRMAKNQKVVMRQCISMPNAAIQLNDLKEPH